MLGDVIHDSDDVEPRNNDSFSAALFFYADNSGIVIDADDILDGDGSVALPRMTMAQSQREGQCW
ncbi:hypothetical protein PBRA_008212 [Plasmodiophora brassicae]|uniref:Uncharacterized protein n=1 Tax=Plasmodiophora brassicae TaxID=37360 RepID=A0A0G4IZZ0_PLABS|nr:hypothetical protein PBRA_008212 [Plasmodiophora brassicae]